MSIKPFAVALSMIAGSGVMTMLYMQISESGWASTIKGIYWVAVFFSLLTVGVAWAAYSDERRAISNNEHSKRNRGEG